MIQDHVAVANGRQRFHAKEKSIEKRAGPHLGNGVRVQQVKHSKKDINEEVRYARQSKLFSLLEYTK
jgi:hypothetical protein